MQVEHLKHFFRREEAASFKNEPKRYNTRRESCKDHDQVDPMREAQAG